MSKETFINSVVFDGKTYGIVMNDTCAGNTFRKGLTLTNNQLIVNYVNDCRLMQMVKVGDIRRVNQAEFNRLAQVIQTSLKDVYNSAL